MNSEKLAFSSYALYKNSGVEWLGQVPEHWEEKRIKDITILERGKFTHRPRNDPQMYDGGYPFIQTGDVARAKKYITEYKQTLSNKGILVSKKFKQGTLLMTIAANIGDVAIVSFDTYFPDSIVGFIPLKNINYLYLFYLFSATRAELNKIKITSTQDNLNLERLNSLSRFIPPLPEQKAIADYLDQKTAQIDHEIDLLSKKTALYSNLKQSLINETVTRGLDKNVALKDSGVEWLGQVPEHWQVELVKRNLSLLTDYTANGSFASLAENVQYQDDGYARLVRLTDLRLSLKNDGLYVSESAYNFLSKTKLFGGEILIANVGANTGLVVKVPPIDTPATLAPNMFLVGFNSRINSDFISYQLNSLFGYGQFQMQITSSAQPKLNKDNLRAVYITFPPLSEQKAIADYLDQKTAQIDSMVSAIGRKIATLQELRKTLINDVVTGQIKVI